MRLRINKRRRGGFSLLEILLALSIFALVITAIYSCWMGILKAAKIGSAAAVDVQRSRISMQMLEDALSCSRSFAADVNHYTFLGENGNGASLSFVAQLPGEFPRSRKFDPFDVRRVTFSLEPGMDSGKQFVLRQNPILADMDKDEKERPLVLAKNVKEFGMKFWDPNKGEWLDEWTQTNQMPLMIKLTLVFNGARKNAMENLTTVTRVVGLPSQMVASTWQTPNAGRAAGGARGAPGALPVINVPGRGQGSITLPR